MTRPFQSFSSQWLGRIAARSAAELGRRATAIDEDVALGCECADPALQIERWPAHLPSERPHAG